VTFVHHKGHQRDPSAFTRWNKLADGYAGNKQPGVFRVPTPG